MVEEELQLEKAEHIPKPKRNSFWIVNYLGLPGPGSQTIGVDNQELTAHGDAKLAWMQASPSGLITASTPPHDTELRVGMEVQMHSKAGGQRPSTKTPKGQSISQSYREEVEFVMYSTARA